MSFTKHIKELNRKIISNTPEFLGQSSQYKLDKIIHNYSTDLCQAYTLIQINASETLSQVYYLSSKLPQVVDFSRFISFYNLGKVDNFLNILDYGVTRKDDKEMFGVVLPYISHERLIGNSLHILQDKGDLILQHVIIPILEVLVQLHTLDLTHGSINQENIWIDLNSENSISGITLSNTCLELPGYSQNPIYEPLNRMLVHRSGKTPSKSADCYAVGILLASLLSSKKITRKGYDSAVTSKAKIGSYDTVIEMFFNGDESILNEIERSIIYWLLNDNEDKRWSSIQALKFLRRRHRTITVGNAIKAMKDDRQSRQTLVKPLVFSGEECYSMTEASVSSIRNYEEIRIRVKNGKLVKELLANDSIKADFISKISILRSLDGFTGNDLISKEDMFLTTFITLLDKSMPIKLKDLSVEPNALWQMSRYVSNRPFTSASNILHKAIISNVISKINNIISKVCGVNVKSLGIPQTEIVQYLPEVGIMSFIHAYSEPSSIYLLNEQICFTVNDILDVLNHSDQDKLNEAISDERLMGHIIGKLASNAKLEVVKNSVLDLTNDSLSMFFFIISLVCELYGRKSLKSLSCNLYERLSTEYLGKIKYLKLRKKIDERLKSAADIGDIMKMYKILNSKEIDKQNEKYAKILKKVDKLNEKAIQANDYAAINYSVRQQTIRMAGMFFIVVLLILLYQISQ